VLIKDGLGVAAPYARYDFWNLQLTDYNFPIVTCEKISAL
jgi:hypothetical protein